MQGSFISRKKKKVSLNSETDLGCGQDYRVLNPSKEMLLACIRPLKKSIACMYWGTMC